MFSREVLGHEIVRSFLVRSGQGSDSSHVSRAAVEMACFIGDFVFLLALGDAEKHVRMQEKAHAALDEWRDWIGRLQVEAQ